MVTHAMFEHAVEVNIYGVHSNLSREEGEKRRKVTEEAEEEDGRGSDNAKSQEDVAPSSSKDHIRRERPVESEEEDENAKKTRVLFACEIRISTKLS